MLDAPGIGIGIVEVSADGNGGSTCGRGSGGCSDNNDLVKNPILGHNL